AYIEDVLKKIAQSNDAIERDLYLNRLAQRFQLDKLTLENQLKELRATGAPNKKQPQSVQTPTQAPRAVGPRIQAPVHYDRIEQAERLLLYRLLHDRSTWLKVGITITV